MTKDSGATPLPRRVPGSANSPRPPARVERPVLPESVRQHLLSVIAQESQRSATEPPERAEPAEQAALTEQPAQAGEARFPEQAAPAERAGPSVRPEPAEQPEPGQPAPEQAPLHGQARPPVPMAPEPAVPLRQKAPGANNGQRLRVKPAWRTVSSLPQLAVHTEAPTEPFSRVAAAPGAGPAGPDAARPGSPPDSTESGDRSSQSHRPDPWAPRAQEPAERPAMAPAPARVPAPAPEEQAGGLPDRRRPAPSGRRYRSAGVFIVVMAVITAGALALALSGHSRAASHGGPLPSQNAGAEASTRNLAAAWVASQVSRAAIVSCDPLMCQALRSHGVPVSDLSQISRDTISPLHSDIVVATATVRAQFGNLLSSVYAPGILGSFGSGELRIDIRQIAPHGPAAYRSQLNADLLARKASGATVLHFAQIAVSPTARKQLLAGQAELAAAGRDPRHGVGTPGLPGRVQRLVAWR